MERIINGVVVELKIGDITKQPYSTAVVNAANAELMPGGGVAGAIHRAAGPLLAEECKPLAPIKPGQAVITLGYNLHNKFVIHCLGPRYGIDKPERELLRDCYENSLNLAEENKIVSVAFPAISTGAFGFPLEEAANVAIKTIIEKTRDLKSVKFIAMVLFDQNAYSVHKKIFN